MNEYGLIGNPLQHSFSKKYFTEKFQKEGLTNCSFELFPLNTISELEAILHSHKDLKGLAVTIPYKVAVLPYLNNIDKAADEMGAVNCIRIDKEKLTGFNTDVIGFEKSFAPLLENHHLKALVLGTGGASRAVQYVLKKLGIPFLIVTRSTPLAEQVNYNFINREVIINYPVIINCTPAGMFPNENTLPEIPYQYLTERNYLYDLVYKPEETLFLKEGKKAGAIVKNGMEMLIIQAEENWRIWNDKKLF
ncbi:MAG: shikimate dehydrogenase [Ferruginibacter sp.]